MKRAISDEAKDQRREAILLAALDEFYISGFKATRMDAIAERVGISKGALYLYFNSKDEIFEQLIALVARPRMEQIEAVLSQAANAREGLSQLIAFMPLLIHQSPLPKVVKVLLSDAFAFPDTVALYRKNIIGRALNAIAQLLERSQQKGEIIACDPALTARLVIAPLLMAVIWRVVFETSEQETQLDLASYFQEHRTLMFRALGLHEEESE